MRTRGDSVGRLCRVPVESGGGCDGCSGDAAAVSGVRRAYASDLYYAIHAFNSKKSSMKNAKTLTITDRYDFAPEKYKGLKAGAVNTVHLAQKRGVAQEYNLRIVAS